MSQRAIRRHHRERLNKRTRYIFTKIQYWRNPWSEEDLVYHVNRHRDNMQINGHCQCCANVRNKKRSWLKARQRLTLQEIRESDRYSDDLLELHGVNEDNESHASYKRQG